MAYSIVVLTITTIRYSRSIAPRAWY